MSAETMKPEAEAGGAGAKPPNVVTTMTGGTPAQPSTGELDAFKVSGVPVPAGDTLTAEEEAALPERKIALVGYTTSKNETPWADLSWELWGMNNLHNKPGVEEHIDRFSRWYNLHDLTDLAKPQEQGGDPAHLAWLREPHPFPVYLMDPYEGVALMPDGAPMPSLAERTGFPSAVAFPKTQILSQFMAYFTNTVSWQIAHAIYEGLHDSGYIFAKLGLYGIDMAVGSEYASQRPSVEYFLGLVQGLGVELELPASSDLLKAAELYGGVDDNSGMRAKITMRLAELHEQKANLERQVEQAQMMHASICGAIDSFSYIEGVWLPPSPKGNARDAVVVPAGSLTPVAQMIAEGEAKDRHANKET